MKSNVRQKANKLDKSKKICYNKRLGDNKMNYADIKFPDIQDGEGIRVALYVSGCHFHCKECHNKEAWDFNFGKKFTNDTIEEIINLLKKPYVQGLSLLGGEPLELSNQEGLLPLFKRVKQELPQKDIWCWTGYNFDTDILNEMYVKNPVSQELLPYIDIIVDGQFELENKIADLAFRGSTNQRKIDVPKSLEKGEMVRMEFGDEARYETQKPKIMYFQEFKTVKKDLTKAPVHNTITMNFNAINEEQPKITIKEEKERIVAKGIE